MTVKTTVPPSPTVVLFGIISYVGGVRDVSFIVTIELVATIEPVTLPVLRSTVNVSAPSVVRSFFTTSLKEARLPTTPTPPVGVIKSLSELVE